MMNEHIKHLEEPLYFGDINNVNLNFLDIIYSKKFSIKIDGSPSIFFGNIDNNFFVATKSIFNKNRKIYFSIDDIDNNVADKELAQKLKNCFNRLKSDFKKNIIYQADLISWCNNENRVYQPNIIQYKLDNDNDINLSIHTTYNDLNFIETEYNDDISHECNHNNNLDLDSKLFEKMLVKYDEWHKNYSYLKKYINEDNFQKIKRLSTKNIPLERYFNHCIRTNTLASRESLDKWFREKHSQYLNLKCESDYFKFIENSIETYNEDWFVPYLFFYNYTTSVKNEIIKDINDYVNNIKIKNHVSSFNILNINNSHEGYVFNNSYKKIKMVNRNEFSYHNFMKHGG